MGASKKRISITIVDSLDEEVSKIAEDMQTSKSSIIESAVKSYLVDKLDRDTKELGEMNFSDLPDEDEWFDLQNEVA